MLQIDKGILNEFRQSNKESLPKLNCLWNLVTNLAKTPWVFCTQYTQLKLTHVQDYSFDLPNHLDIIYKLGAMSLKSHGMLS